MVIWLIGLSGAGKTTIGRQVFDLWRATHKNTVFVDGDEIRDVFRHDGPADYTVEGRRRNSLRISALCRWLDRQDINVVCSILSIFEDHRRANREVLPRYFEVYLRVSMEDLSQRDYKGLYRAAREGKMPDVVGMDIPFSPPERPDLILENGNPPVDPKRTAELILAKAGALS